MHCVGDGGRPEMRLLQIQASGGDTSCRPPRGADDTISASWTLYLPPLALLCPQLQNAFPRGGRGKGNYVAKTTSNTRAGGALVTRVSSSGIFLYPVISSKLLNLSLCVSISLATKRKIIIQHKKAPRIK